MIPMTRYPRRWRQLAFVLLTSIILVLVTVDPLHSQHGDEPWKLEKASVNILREGHIIASYNAYHRMN